MIDIKRIIQLLDEADDIVSALYRQGANKDYKCKSLREKLKEIYAEITTPPKSNGDRIRQMTDEELARFLNIDSICHEMMKDRKACPNCSCGDCIRMWLGRKRGKE